MVVLLFYYYAPSIRAMAGPKGTNSLPDPSGARTHHPPSQDKLWGNNPRPTKVGLPVLEELVVWVLQNTALP